MTFSTPSVWMRRKAKKHEAVDDLIDALIKMRRKAKQKAAQRSKRKKVKKKTRKKPPRNSSRRAERHSPPSAGVTKQSAEKLRLKPGTKASRSSKPQT